MRRLVIWSLVAAVLFVGWTINKQGVHDAFGGAFSFFSPAPAEEILDQTFLYADPQPEANPGSAVAPHRVLVTDAVRQRVTASMAAESQRHK